MIAPRPLSWISGSNRLAAMLHETSDAPRGAILMLPGGSDYRIGSHRSYVRLAQTMANSGYAVMRLDVAGMGDSSGHHRGFEALGPDLASAIEILRQNLPKGTKVFLWGQCDGASAILLGLGRDFAADGAILCNPWARTAQTSADQVIRHHYRHRLTSGASWRRLLRGQTNIAASAKSVLNALRVMFAKTSKPNSYLDDIISTLQKGTWPFLIVLGSEDAGGQEFRLLCQRHKVVARAMEQALIAGGNHSFSHPDQRQQLERIALTWLKSRTKTW
jgi:uncharacterized protein